ncbi:MAG: hypothetical protein HY779_04075 [Rubrobacteridae bacterium]|nr:hypothetical protein [Rubrobacteridae bacterium]
MKKIMLASLSIVLCIGLSACTGSNKVSSTTDTAIKKTSSTSTTKRSTTAETSVELPKEDTNTGTTVLDVSDDDKIISADTEKTIFGNWVVAQQLVTDEFYDEKTSKNLLKGKRVSFSKELASFDKNKCKSPIYKELEYTNYDLFMKTHVELRTFGIEGSWVTMIEVYEPKNPPTFWNSTGSHFFIKDSKTLILIDKGKYYLMNKVE